MVEQRLALKIGWSHRDLFSSDQLYPDWFRMDRPLQRLLALEARLIWLSRSSKEWITDKKQICRTRKVQRVVDMETFTDIFSERWGFVNKELVSLLHLLMFTLLETWLIFIQIYLRFSCTNSDSNCDTTYTHTAVGYWVTWRVYICNLPQVDFSRSVLQVVQGKRKRKLFWPYVFNLIICRNL